MSETKAERDARRQAYLDAEMEKARIHAAKRGRSIACGEYGRHDRCVGNQQPDECLCECHDPVSS